ncbi:MAG TPA: hypothetical protein VGO29_09160 [Solirubrobacteraceae bacterium]|nr:hypothetical protein [Solirubrobacteraceae bacterium]
MLSKAHHDPASEMAGRTGRWIAVVSLCVLSIALTISAEARAASTSGAGTLGAVVQTTTQQLSSQARTAVEHVAGAALAPTASQQAAASAQQALPANTAAAPTTTKPHDTGIAGAVVPIVQAAGERIAAASGIPGSAGGAAVTTIVHSVTGAGGSSRLATVTGVVQRATSPGTAAGDIALAAAAPHAVVRATSSSHVVGTPARDTSTHATGGGGAVRHPTRRSAGPTPAPAPAPRPKSKLTLADTPPAATQQPRAVAGTAATAATAGANTPAAGFAAGPVSETGSLLFGERSAAGALAAHRAHRGPPPASPAPAPAPSPSPGGASPSAAVGPAAGIAMALALAALLTLAAPRALRRLRLHGESWRLAPLVLIADRPG